MIKVVSEISNGKEHYSTVITDVERLSKIETGKRPLGFGTIEIVGDTDKQSQWHDRAHTQ